MNILIIPSWYPNKKTPGNGIFFKDQAVALAAHGHHVTVIDVSLQGAKETFNTLNFRFTHQKENGVDVYAFKIPSLYFLGRTVRIYSWIFKKLLFFIFKKLLKEGKAFDIIHAHSFFPAGQAACLLSKKCNIPLVVTEHSSAVQNKKLGAKKRKILEETVNNCSLFICVSNALKESIYSQVKTQVKLQIVPNMFSSNFDFHGIKNPINDEFVFFSTGGLIERKQHGFAISCFKEAFKDIDNVKFLIAGDGILYNTLQTQIKSEGLAEKVQLLGWLNKEQLTARLKACNVFILVSKVETFGIVYIEAMACGRPVIATKNGGAEDIVNESNGILVDVGNREQLINAFRNFYENYDSYNQEKISQDCQAKYSEKEIVKQLELLYNTIV